MYPAADRIFDLSVIWKRASEIFPCFDRCAVDWDAQYRSFLARAAASETELDFHLLLAEFVNLLGDGHTDYSLPLALRDAHGHLPFLLRHVDGRWCIDAAFPEYSAFSRTELLEINGVPIHSLIRTLFKYCYHVGDYIPSYRLQQFLPLLLSSGNNIARTDKGNFSFDLSTERPQFSLLPLHSNQPYRQLLCDPADIRIYEDRLLYIRLDDFMHTAAPDAVRLALESHPEAEGLLLDVRENIGGMTLNGAAVAKLLIPGEFHACRKKTRSMTGISLSSASQLIQWSEEDIARHIAAGHSTRDEIDESFSFIRNVHFDHYTDSFGDQENHAVFTGPCVLLTSRHTLSAAEDFTAMLRTNHRAQIIGAPTSGTTGTPFMQRLSCGGLVRICSVAYRLLDGTEFIGCGISPDIPCELSLRDYTTGHDAVLEEGLKVLQKML